MAIAESADTGGVAAVGGDFFSRRPAVPKGNLATASVDAGMKRGAGFRHERLRAISLD